MSNKYMNTILEGLFVERVKINEGSDEDKSKEDKAKESDLETISKGGKCRLEDIDGKSGKGDVKKILKDLMSGDSLRKSLNVEESVDEDKWVTIKGTHVLVDDKGTIKNDNIRKKIEAKDKSSSSKGESDKEENGIDTEEKGKIKKGADKLYKENKDNDYSGEIFKNPGVKKNVEIAKLNPHLTTEVVSDALQRIDAEVDKKYPGISDAHFREAAKAANELSELSSEELDSQLKEAGIDSKDSRVKELKKAIKKYNVGKTDFIKLKGDVATINALGRSGRRVSPETVERTIKNTCDSYSEMNSGIMDITMILTSLGADN